MKKIIVASLICVIAGRAVAANLGPNGHPAITYDEAVSAGLGNELAKVVALGVMQPDADEFANPAAHAQPPDPPSATDGHLSQAGYDELQRDSFDRSVQWHDFYFKASVEQMNEGHREAAAFLLGYAMHNSEDFPVHQGLPNLVHAEADKVAISPDVDASRLRAAHEWAKDDLKQFRLEVGEQNWALFKGEAVRQPGITDIVPEPLTRFANLSSWDPHVGVMPLPYLREWVMNAYTERFGQSPSDQDLKFWNKWVEVPLGLHAREQAMLDILDKLPRAPGDPVAPSEPSLLEIKNFLKEFIKTDPERYQHLSAEEQKMLGETDIWREKFAARLQERHARLEALRQKSLAAHERVLKDLRDRQARLANQAKRLAEIRNNIEQGAQRAREFALREANARFGPPAIDFAAQEASQRAQERAQAEALEAQRREQERQLAEAQAAQEAQQRELERQQAKEAARERRAAWRAKFAQGASDAWYAGLEVFIRTLSLGIVTHDDLTSSSGSSDGWNDGAGDGGSSSYSGSSVEMNSSPALNQAGTINSTGSWGGN